MLYRRPRFFVTSLNELPRRRSIQAGFVLTLYALACSLVIALIGRALLGMGIDSAVGAVHGDVPFGNLKLVLFAEYYLRGIALGVTVGITICLLGIGIARLRGVTNDAIGLGIAFALCGVIFFGISDGATQGTTSTIPDRLVTAFALGQYIGILFRTFLGGAGMFGAVNIGATTSLPIGIVDSSGAGAAVGVLSAILGVVAGLRLYYFIPHPFFLWPTTRWQLYPWHPVAWDDGCSIPFPKLDQLLVAYAERSPEGGFREIERLLDYPSQRSRAT